MWTAPDGGAAAVALDGPAAYACDTRTIVLLDCEPDAAPTFEDPRFIPIVDIDTSAKPAPEQPHEERGGAHVTYTIALVSDYRRGGTSRSDGKPALQGAVDVRFPDRWNVGVRSSSIASHGNVELSFYGAKTIAIGETDLSLGATLITFPRDPKADWAMLQLSASRAIGPIDATVSVLYAPEQGNMDDEDNLYVVARARTPIGRVFDTPVTLGASIGRMRGHFADAETRSDWSISLAANVHGIDFGLAYVDNDLGDSRGDPTAVFSVTRSF